MNRARTTPAPTAARAPGFHKPTTTPVPDELFDEWLAVLSGAELKCLLYVIRRTLGFKKDIDAISLKQMVHGITTRDGRVLDSGTGLNRSTVVTALAGLEARGLITVVRAADEQGAALTSTYALRWRGEADAVPPEAPRPTRKPARAVALATGQETVTAPAPQNAVTVVAKFPYPPPDPAEVDGKYDHPAPQAREVVQLSNQGSRIIRKGWADKAPGPVAGSDPQETAQHTDQATDPNDESKARGAGFAGTTPGSLVYSPYIAGVVMDHSRELGDAGHGPANVTQALRLWQQSGQDEATFVACLHEARTRVRTAQGKQARGGIANKMAYFFRVLEDLTGGTGRQTADGRRQ
ncbi:MAG TPA: hypothetical protein VM536_05870 [Chloroflexia bacterium]|nr:hypothetical protein [Chloroflexia bacterium]